MTHAPRAERHETTSCENPFGEIIYSYSRTQAIEDGVLVDLSQADSIRQHWKYPFACTSAVWAIIEEALQKPGQDVSGICHDISTMAKLAIRNAQDARDAEQTRSDILIAVITPGQNTNEHRNRTITGQIIGQLCTSNAFHFHPG